MLVSSHLRRERRQGSRGNAESPNFRFFPNFRIIVPHRTSSPHYVFHVSDRMSPDIIPNMHWESVKMREELFQRRMEEREWAMSLSRFQNESKLGNSKSYKRNKAHINISSRFITSQSENDNSSSDDNNCYNLFQIISITSYNPSHRHVCQQCTRFENDE